MTRTELVAIAHRVKDNPIDTYPSPYGKGIVYEGCYRCKPFYAMYTPTGVPVCVLYASVLYLLTNTGNTSTTKDVHQFFEEHNCTTRVYLYQNSGLRLYVDSEGDFRSESSMNKSFACDYMDLIPLPRL